MEFIDTVTIADGGLRKTQDGYLVADVRTARVGVQNYRGSEVGRPEMAVVRVYRGPDEVFNDASRASFAHKPITMGHPEKPVSSKTWKDVAKGSVGDTITKDGDFVRVPMLIMDEATIAAVEAGTRELSPGYSADIVHDAGTTPDGLAFDAYQTNIRVNHVAVVPKGRSGSQVRIGDAVAPINDQEDIPVTSALTAVVVFDAAYQVNDEGAKAIALLKDALKTTVADVATLTASHKTAIDAKDGEIGGLKAQVAALNDAAAKSPDLDALVTARSALVSTAKTLVKDLDATGLSDGDIRKKVVAARMGDEALKDASDAMVEGMFRVLAKDADKVDPVREAFRTPVTNLGDAAAQAIDARVKMYASFANGGI